MRYQIHEHRHALNLFTTDQEFVPLYQEIVDVLDGISDEDVIAEYNANHRENIKSLSEPMRLFAGGLVLLGGGRKVRFSVIQHMPTLVIRNGGA